LIFWNASKMVGSNWTSGVVWTTKLISSDGTGPGQGSRASTIKLVPEKGIVMVVTTGESKIYAFDMNTGAKLWDQDLGFLAMSCNFGPDNNIMLAFDSSNMVMHGYNVATNGPWSELWQKQIGIYPWDSQMSNPTQAWAYGNYYIGSFSGHMNCIDPTTGNTKWSFYVGDTTETPYGTWAIYTADVVADGKIYFATTEHSPTQPRTRGNQMFCVDAYTGTKIGVYPLRLGHKLSGMATSHHSMSMTGYCTSLARAKPPQQSQHHRKS